MNEAYTTSTPTVNQPFNDGNQSILLSDLGKLMQLNQAKVHEVKLPFSGSQQDVLQFSDFLNQFRDLIGCRNNLYSDCAKQLYLKSYLQGSALYLIKHLLNEDSNYDIARFSEKGISR